MTSNCETTTPTMISSSPVPIARSQGRRARRTKERSVSSLSGMFESESSLCSTMSERSLSISPPSSPEMSGRPIVDSTPSTEKYSSAEREELLAMTRKLRQAKRRLFLKSASKPTDSVNQLRDILLRISFDEQSFATAITAEDSNSSFTSLPSLTRHRSAPRESLIQE